jgi:hypothetical protein
VAGGVVGVVDVGVAEAVVFSDGVAGGGGRCVFTNADTDRTG